jgi:hypothetical protein
MAGTEKNLCTVAHEEVQPAHYPRGESSQTYVQVELCISRVVRFHPETSITSSSSQEIGEHPWGIDLSPDGKTLFSANDLRMT